MTLRSLLKLLFLGILPATVLLIAPYLEALQDVFAAVRLPDDVRKGIGLTWLWISLSVWVAGLVGRIFSAEFARRRGRVAPPQLLRDLVRYGFLILAITFTLRYVWGDQFSPLIGALGVGGVVLGFALQETLSNFFAGLALLMEQPFTQGDWVKIGDRLEGVVEHITWRATKIRTRDSDFQIFPNSVVAKEVIVNFRQPAPLHAIRIHVGTSYDDPPDKVKRVLREVVDGVPQVLKIPTPIAYVKQYADFSINYEIKAFIEDYERRPVIEDAVMTRLWYAFQREGITIPFPIQTTYEYKGPWEARPTRPRPDFVKVLGEVPIFAPLQGDELALLASTARVLEYSDNEVVLRQGDPGDALFIVVHGEARVVVRSPQGVESLVARIQPKGFFGEMSLLTGEPRTATIMAGGSLLLVRVEKAGLSPILGANPALAGALAEVVAARRKELEEKTAETGVTPTLRKREGRATENILDRIRRFFGM